MKVQFSSSVLGFFAQNMIGDNSYHDDLPDDLIELTDREILTYWKKNPPEGKTLGAIDGRPAWVDLPPSTHEELIASANAKKSQLKSVADSEIEWQ